MKTQLDISRILSEVVKIEIFYIILKKRVMKDTYLFTELLHSFILHELFGMLANSTKSQIN